MSRLRQLCDRYPIPAFLLLAFGIAWTLWVPGLVISHGRFVTFGGFGIYAPALAGMILSHRGKDKEGSSSRARLVCFLIVFFAAAVVYVLFHTLRMGEALSPQVAIPAALISMLVAWIVSGAYSRDSGTSEFLWTLNSSRKMAVATDCLRMFRAVPGISGCSCSSAWTARFVSKFERDPESRGFVPHFVCVNFLFRRGCFRRAGLARFSASPSAAEIFSTGIDHFRVVAVGLVARSSRLQRRDWRISWELSPKPRAAAVPAGRIDYVVV